MRLGINKVVIDGLMKENTLKRTVDKNNKDIIMGNITVYTGEHNEVKVGFYVRKLDKDGNPTKTYPAVEKLLPENTVSFASIVSQLENSGLVKSSETNLLKIEDYKDRVTPVSCIGSLQENIYFSKKDNKVKFGFQVRGMTAYKQQAALSMKTSFETELYVDSVREEHDSKTQEETGRLLIKGLSPEYDNGVSEFNLVAGDKEVVNFISSEVKPGDTMTVRGNIVNVIKRTLKQKAQASFGQAGEDIYTTDFVQELVITGGNAKVLHEGEDKDAYTREEIKAARCVRQEKIAEKEAEQGSSANASVPKPGSAAMAGAKRIEF